MTASPQDKFSSRLGRQPPGPARQISIHVDSPDKPLPTPSLHPGPGARPATIGSLQVQGDNSLAKRKSQNLVSFQKVGKFRPYKGSRGFAPLHQLPVFSTKISTNTLENGWEIWASGSKWMWYRFTKRREIRAFRSRWIWHRSPRCRYPRPLDPATSLVDTTHRTTSVQC